jgi:Arc/MetJ-type ribon-helix-helix transcriptional regulator
MCVTTKQRLSASVDADLVAAAEDAVGRGDTASVSAWVNDAMRLKLAHDRRLAALAAFVDAFERECGEISDEEMALAARRARSRASLVRGARRAKGLARRARRTG